MVHTIGRLRDRLAHLMLHVVIAAVYRIKRLHRQIVECDRLRGELLRLRDSTDAELFRPAEDLTIECCNAVFSASISFMSLVQGLLGAMQAARSQQSIRLDGRLHCQHGHVVDMWPAVHQ
jgi:hypothetical protein